MDFGKSCLQLMTSRNSAVYRYHGVSETVYYRRTFRNNAHPCRDPDLWLAVQLRALLVGQVVSAIWW